MKRRSLLLLAGLCLSLSAPAARAQTERWTALTSLRESTALAAGEGVLWVAATGGVYAYAPASGEVRRFTAGDGLHGPARALALDPGCGDEGCVWIGYADGVLDRLDVGAGTVRTFRDIERATQFEQRGINRLVLQGDSLLVAASFGLVVFDRTRGEVRDTYSRIGEFAQATPVYDAAVAPLPEGGAGLWLATGQGVGAAPLGGRNLTDPKSWRNLSSGLPSAEVLALEYAGGALYAGTRGGAARRVGGAWQSLGVGGGAVTELARAGNLLYGIEAEAIIEIGAGGAAVRKPAPGLRALVGAAAGAEGLWLADALEGLALVRPAGAAVEVARTYYPAGPYHNVFSDVAVGPEGALWLGGTTAGGTGFYRADADGAWTDFTERNAPALARRSGYTRIFIDRDGGFWAGSQGGALAYVGPNGAPVVYDQTNSSLRQAEGAGNNPAFILIGGIGQDPQGNIWVTTRDATNALNVRTPDGAWAALPVQECNGLTAQTGSYDRLFVDSFGQKWLTVVDKRNLRRTIGLVVLDTGETPANPGDDVCRFFGVRGSGGRGLPEVEVNAITQDLDGAIWIGTSSGPAFLANTGIVAQDPTATFTWPFNDDATQDRRFLLEDVAINDIAVDPSNRLWMAMDQGVRLVEASGAGYRVVREYSTANAPLLSDRVGSVAVNPRTGAVYFSTELGLVSLQGDAVAAADKAQDLRVYPNPLRMGDGPALVTIDGLTMRNEIRILAADGRVLRLLEARGGRAAWDGLDEAGRPVPSGVYVIVAVSTAGAGTAYGKVAVIR